jgi:sigma-B regulation protein RsbU (phosphoserine phosphatase)
MNVARKESAVAAAVGAKPDSQIFGCPILVVDDAQSSRELISRMLRNSGFWNIEFATDGMVALRQIAKFRPDLVILDIRMPVLDGIEVCRRLRADPATADLPVLIQTGMTDRETRNAVFDLGATDLLTKPLHRAELVARVRTQLQRQVTLQGLQNYVRQTEEDLRAARVTQLALLPTAAGQSAITEATGVRIGSYFATSTMLGGDIWGLCDLGATRLGVYVADFAGHGIAAALNTFRLHTLLHELRPFRGSPDRMLREINAKLAGLLPTGQFATMFYGVIDLTMNRLAYAVAGCPPALVWQGVAGPIHLLDGSGVPLGVTASAEYPLQEVDFPPSAALLVFSDALIEGRRNGAEPAGESGVAAAVRAVAGLVDPTDLVRRLCTDLLGDAANAPSDDVTVVCLRR